MLAPRLHNFLDERHASYETLTHDRTVTAQQTASAAHIGQRHFAKTVMLKIEGRLAMLVMPSAFRVDLSRLSRALGGREVDLAHEIDFKMAFPDCELGAMPPFGNLFGMDTYVDRDLAKEEYIAFNAGTHTDVIAMRFNDYRRLAHPKLVNMALAPVPVAPGASPL